MIDFIKLNINYLNQKELTQNPLLAQEFFSKVNENSGEVFYPLTAKHHNLFFRITPTKKELSGSIHILHNLINGYGRQNMDDFYFEEILKTIKFLESNFNIIPNKTIIQELEYGVNLELPNFDASQIITQNIIVCDGRVPTENKTFGGTGKGVKFTWSRYFELKIYDKGRHQANHNNILRIEIRAKKGT